MNAPAAMLGAVFLDLRGPEFLAFYAIALAAGLVFLAVLRRKADRSVDLPEPALPEQLDARELAWLRGGVPELVRLTGLDLLQRGYVIVKGSDRLESHPTPPPKRHLSAPSRSMLELIKDQPSRAGLKTRASAAFAGEAEDLEKKAREEQLLTDEKAQASLNTAAWVLLIILLGIGLLKLWTALQRGRTNVGFLLILMVVALIGILLIRKLPRLSARGRRYLEQAQAALSGLKARAPSLVENMDPMLILAAGAFGTHILTSTSYGTYHRYYHPPGQGSSCSGGSSSSSCGSGSSCSSGSSGCGGGGGGGCGGCGGCGGGGGD